MIEFIGVCVCSACLSCICCLITGGLCIMPAAVRYRNKLVEKHLPDDMQWLGNLPPCEVCESDSSSSSDSCPRGRRSSYSRISEDDSRQSTKECNTEAVDIDGNKSLHCHRSSGKKTTRKVKSCERSAPRRWTFCFNLGKSTRNSSEFYVPVEEAEKPIVVENKQERTSCRHKKSKRSRSRKHASKTYCAYFKSCSCTNFRDQPTKKRRYKKSRSEKSSARCPSEFQRDKRRSKTSRKTPKCPKNCKCSRIMAENKIPVYHNEREVEKCCNCGAKKSLNDKTRRGHCSCK